MLLIYMPTFLSPKNTTINPSVINSFTCQINGNSCNKYRLKIYKNSDSTLVYDTNEVTITTLYNKDILSINIPASTLVAGIEYKWTIQLFEGANSVTSGETFFKSFGLPTITLTLSNPITSKSYDFIGTYSHPQNISIKKFKFILYDNEDSIIKETDYSFGGKIHLQYNGLLSGNSYKIECIVIDQNDIQITSGKQTFSVSYAQPSINIKPIVELLKDKSAIRLSWTDGAQILGTTTGTYSFVNDFVKTGNHALQLDIGSTLEYHTAIPETFTHIMTVKPTGKFSCKFDETYIIGYDGTRFYFINNDIFVSGVPRTLPTDPFIIAIKPTHVIIKSNIFTEILKV